jgi:hypothetical protein
MIAGVQDSLMPSWPDHLSSGNQKRFQRDPVNRKRPFKNLATS